MSRWMIWNSGWWITLQIYNQVICVLYTYFSAVKMSVSCSFSPLAWIASGVTWCGLVIWPSLWVAWQWASVLCSWNKARAFFLVRDEEASLDWVLFLLNIDFSMWKHPHCWIPRSSDPQQLTLVCFYGRTVTLVQFSSL